MNANNEFDYRGYKVKITGWGSKWLVVIDGVEQRYNTGKYAKLYRFTFPVKAIQCARNIIDARETRATFDQMAKDQESDHADFIKRRAMEHE